MFRIIIGILATLSTSAVMAEGDPARGETLTPVCQACHGPDGNSLVGAFPNLAGQGAIYLTKQLHDIKSGDRPIAEMVGQLDNMSDQDIEDLAAYYASQSAKQGAAKADLVELGETIYRAGIPRKKIAACTSCHLPSGEGNDLAKFPSLAGQWPEYLEKQLRAFRTGARANDGEGRMMRATAMDLSDEEIAAVSSYIYGLR
jgi:cytochrome c553